tara:strand:- start:4339 stop:4542 length:204 start_codon:yes stop_codon:yes gene_type:complete
MPLVVNDVLEKITDNSFTGERFKITKLKNISGNVHAYIVNINDENTEYMVALSVLEDEKRFKVVKEL